MSPETRERTWTVGELAKELAITTRTLRFYEAEGLIAPERRGTVRIFHPRDHTRLRLILRGKRFGMSLPEIREIVDMYDGAASSERRQLETLLSRLAEISSDLDQRAEDLRRIMTEVETVSRQCLVRLADLGTGDTVVAAPATVPQDSQATRAALPAQVRDEEMTSAAQIRALSGQPTLIFASDPLGGRPIAKSSQ